jgi:glycosyltransferase involved in cell wall biosynthesis
MEYIQENEIEDKVIFTGYVTESEKYWLMKKAIGFIFLSKYEGFGIPPLESLVLGTPVLLNDISVFRELFENDAIYVNANDIREIAEGMNNLLTMKQKSKYKCLEKFNWKKSGEKFSKIIKQLTDKSQKQ